MSVIYLLTVAALLGPHDSTTATRGGPSFCQFPFIFRNIRYSACTSVGDPDEIPWCSTKTNNQSMHIEGNWRHCDANQPEIQPRLSAKKLVSGPSFCKFPFIYKHVRYSTCTTVDDPDEMTWCSTETNNKNKHIEGNWKHCDANQPEAESGLPVDQDASESNLDISSTTSPPEFIGLSDLIISYKGPIITELEELVMGLDFSNNDTKAFNMSYMDRLRYAQEEIEHLQYNSIIYSEADSQEEESLSSSSSSEAASIVRQLQEASLIAPVKELFDEAPQLENEEEEDEEEVDNLQLLKRLMFLQLISLPKDNIEVEQAILSEELENILFGRSGRSIFGHVGSRTKECHIWDAAARRWRQNLVCKGGIKPKLNLLRPRRRRRRPKGNLGSLG